MNCYNTYFEVAGRIAAIYDAREIAPNALIRQMLIECEPERSDVSNSVTVTLFGERCGLADRYKAGDLVRVSGEICATYHEVQKIRRAR